MSSSLSRYDNMSSVKYWLQVSSVSSLSYIVFFKWYLLNAKRSSPEVISFHIPYGALCTDMATVSRYRQEHGPLRSLI